MTTLFKTHSKRFSNYKEFLKNNKPISYIKKSETVALFTNARNEIHIREWAAHHLLLGFDYIFIADHKSTTPLKYVFYNFDKRVKTFKCPIDGAIKLPLMNKAIEIAKEHKVDWFIYLDADEFIILNNPNMTNIKHFLNFFNFADMIGINWLMFGSNLLENEPPNILSHYTKSELLLNRHIKTFVRPNEALFAETPHSYVIRNPSKFFCYTKRMNTITSYNEYPIPFYKSPIYIAHYCMQSKESFIKRKINLPTDDTMRFRDKKLVDVLHLHYNDVENNQPHTLYSQKVQKFLQQHAIPPPSSNTPTDSPHSQDS